MYIAEKNMERLPRRKKLITKIIDYCFLNNACTGNRFETDKQI